MGLRLKKLLKEWKLTWAVVDRPGRYLNCFDDYNLYLTTSSSGDGSGSGIPELCASSIQVDLGLVGTLRESEDSFGKFLTISYRSGYRSISSFYRRVDEGEAELFIKNPLGYCHGIQNLKYINSEFCYILPSYKLANNSIGCLISFKNICRNKSIVKVHHGYIGIPRATASIMLENNNLYMLDRCESCSDKYLLY